MAKKLLAAAAVLAVAGCGGATLDPQDLTFSEDGLSAAAPACPGPAALGDARCHARVKGDAKGSPNATSAPSGLGANDVQSAYGLSATGGGGRILAIVDAYHYPEAEADLAAYRSQYGLPACTKANGCFMQVNQDGVAGSYPRSDSGWVLEEALDIDMASASCPGCKILLVEASSNSFVNLGTAVNTAVRLGAFAISNSYGGSEYSGEATDQNTYFNHPGVAITVSSGDNGYGVEFPAASQYVTAVGGTNLKKASGGRGWTETAWSGAGSGCSAYVAKPSWQHDTGCAKRSVADVSAVADPNTGVAVYDTHGYQGLKGWFTVGGTSASSPIIAGVYCQAGTAITYGEYPYAHTTSLWDVTSGSNGSCGNYLCNAGTGFDGPTGLGTPNGTGAF